MYKYQMLTAEGRGYSLPRVASLLIAGSACCSAGVAKSEVVMVRDRSVGVVDVDVVRDRLAGVNVLEPVVVDDRLAAVDVSDSSCD